MKHHNQIASVLMVGFYVQCADFVFTTGAHNLLHVPPADVSACNILSAIKTYNSSVSITLATTGSYGYICGFPTHCADSGMQLLVTVNAAAAPGTAPVAAPKSSSSAPPAPPGTTSTAPPAASPGNNSASALQTGPAMAMGALLAACAVLAF